MQDSILQIVCGYLFICVFNFTSLRRNTKNIQHLLLSSFTIGFIIVKLIKLIPININDFINSIGICVTSIICAYISGLLLTNNKLEWILDKLKIRQSVHPNTWAELMDTKKQMKMKLVLKDGTTYYGYVYHIGEETPAMIALAAYKINNQEYNLDDNKIILVNTSDLKYAEIIYHPDSNKTERIYAFNQVVRNGLNKKN